MLLLYMSARNHPHIFSPIDRRPNFLLDPADSITASSVADVFSHPRVAPLVAAYHKQDPATADIPCVSELETFFECIGEACINCIVEVIMDMEEDPTCESLKSSNFCQDMNACATGDCAGKEESCKVAGEALVTCAEENYPASEDTGSDEDECPGLCEEEEVLDVAHDECKFCLCIDLILYSCWSTNCLHWLLLDCA